MKKRKKYHTVYLFLSFAPCSGGVSAFDESFCEAVLLGELFSWEDKSAERSACSGNKLRSECRAPFEEEAGVSEGEPVKVRMNFNQWYGF